MELISPQQLQEFTQAARKVACYGLLRCSSGNMSWRIAENKVAVTAKGTWLGELNDDGVAVCNLASEVLNGKRASVETRFHCGILETRTDINVVLHYQSPYATAIGASYRRDYNFNVISEIPFYVGPVGWVEFLIPGSPELAQAVIAMMQKHDLIILKNHGQVVVGKDFDDAIQKAAFFELACQIILTNPDAGAIGPEGIKTLRTMAQNSKRI